MYYQQINSVLTHADVVITTTAPSGSPFAATDAAVSTEFVFNTPLDYECFVARIQWRILIQVVAMQVNEMMHTPSGPEPQAWQNKIEDTIKRLNQKAQIFRPQFIPSDIVPPTEEYRVLSVTGNWCDKLIEQLACMFSNVQNAGTLKIELFPLDAVPAKRNVDTASIDNAPAPLEAGTI